MRVEFTDLVAGVVRGSATVGPDGRVAYTAAEGQTLPGWLEGELAPQVRALVDGRAVVVTEADGERFLRALPHVYRSPLFSATLIEA